MDEQDYSQYSDDQLQEAINLEMSRDTFRSDEDLYGLYDRIEKMKSEYNKRNTGDRFIDVQNNQYAMDLQRAKRLVPNWVARPNQTVEMTYDLPSNYGGKVDRQESNTAKLNLEYANNPLEMAKTLIHESAHVGQLQNAPHTFEKEKDWTKDEMQDIIDKTFPWQPEFNKGNVPTGFQQKEYQILEDRFGQNKDLTRATNYGDNPLELFAAMEEKYVMDALARGKSVQDSEWGKQMGLEDPKLRKYFYDRTLKGIPTIHEQQAPTLSEKTQMLLDKFRNKLKHRFNIE